MARTNGIASSGGYIIGELKNPMVERELCEQAGNETKFGITVTVPVAILQNQAIYQRI